MAAQAKKYEKVNRDKREKIHLLSGILKCPVCGAGMYVSCVMITNMCIGYVQSCMVNVSLSWTAKRTTTW